MAASLSNVFLDNPAKRRVVLHANVGIRKRPTFACLVNEAYPHQVVFFAIVHQEMSKSLSLGRIKWQYRTELDDRVHCLGSLFWAHDSTFQHVLRNKSRAP